LDNQYPVVIIIWVNYYMLVICFQTCSDVYANVLDRSRRCTWTCRLGRAFLGQVFMIELEHCLCTFSKCVTIFRGTRISTLTALRTSHCEPLMNELFGNSSAFGLQVQRHCIVSIWLLFGSLRCFHALCQHTIPLPSPTSW
jgi:hypothetical protein